MRSPVLLILLLAAAAPFAAAQEVTPPGKQSIAELLRSFAEPEWKTRNAASRELALRALVGLTMTSRRLPRSIEAPLEALGRSGTPEQQTRARQFRAGWRKLVTDDLLSELSRYPEQSVLNLGGMNRVTDAGLARLAACKKLEALDLDCAGLTDAGLAHLARLPALRELLLDGKLTEKGLVHLLKVPSLRKLTTRIDITDAGVAHLANLTGLVELRVMYSVPYVVEMKAGPGPSAVKIVREDVGISDEGVAKLAALTSLTSLSLPGLTQPTGPGLAGLVELPHLRHLDISGWKKIRPAALDHVGKMLELRSLALSCSWGGLGSFDRIKRLTKLTKLDLRIGFNDEKELTHLAGMTQMRELGLRVMKLTGAGARHLSGMKSLVRLDLRGTGSVDHEAMAALAKNHRVLESLSLWAVDVTDAGVVPWRGHPALRIVDLGSSKHLTDASVKTVATLPKLEYVRLAGNKVSKDMADWLRRTRPRVRVIH